MYYFLKKYQSHYHLLSDERAAFAQYSIANNELEQVGKISDITFPWIEGRRRVIATTKPMGGHLPQLDVAAVNILLGEADVKALASEWALKNSDATMGTNSALNRGFISGFNKCLELNIEKKFTTDDMAQMILWLSMTGKFLYAPTGNISGNKPIVEEFLRTRNAGAKTEWRVQIEVDDTPDGMPGLQPTPKVTNGYITITKILKA